MPLQLCNDPSPALPRVAPREGMVWLRSILLTTHSANKVMSYGSQLGLSR